MTRPYFALLYSAGSSVPNASALALFTIFRTVQISAVFFKEKKPIFIRDESSLPVVDARLLFGRASDFPPVGRASYVCHLLLHR